MYLDYAELQAEQRAPMHMADWVKKLDGFLQFNEQNILTHAGKVSQELALDRAGRDFEKFADIKNNIELASDFDQIVEKTRRLKPPSNSNDRDRKK